jgi:type II secretory pathway component PulC
MAIINGEEYGEGEALDVKGFILKTVSPTRVVIENRATRKLLDVPLQE